MTNIRGSRAGFTLIELMISLTILTVVMAALMGAVLSVQRGYVNQRERVRAQESLRAAQMTMVTILRSAGADPTSSGMGLLNPDPDGNGVFDDVRVVTDFNMDGDILDPLEDVRAWVASDTLWVRWQGGASAQALAAPIRSLRFEYYANDGTQFTVPVQTVGATRARFIIEAPRDPRSGTLERIESWWVNLRNRTGT
jgi:prepilin-type N-terminal cleavage/methylation domain-containing protein